MKKTCFIVLLVCSTSIITAQQKLKVGNNPTTINPAAALEVESTNKGFLPPRMTNTQRDAITTPSTGLQVYCTDCSPAGLYNYTGSVWTPIGSLTGGTLTSGNIVVGNASNKASSVPMSGDISINNSGATTIQNSAVSYSKIQNVTATDKVLGRISTGSGVIEEINTTGTGNVVRANSPTFTGDAQAVTATAGDNDTSLATTAFVTSAVTTATTPNATTLATGKIQLAGDLSGTATAPVVAASAITSAKIADGTIVTADIANSAVDLTSKVTGILPGANGGTGVANTGKTITLGGNLTTTGAFATTLTTTAATSVTLPTTGTLATTSDITTAIASKQDVSNLSTNMTTDAASTTKYPSVSLIKSYVDAADALEAPLASPTFTGDAKAVTATAGDNDTSLATTAFVTSAVTTATTPNATTLATGKIQLAGDLSGTATAPVVAASAITSAKIADGTIVTADIANSAVDLTSKVTGILPGANGGTGVANTGKTITLGGNLTTTGAFATTLTTTAATSVTLPTTGTLATTSDITTAIASKQDVSNLSTNMTTDAASTTKYPSVSLIKSYVDAADALEAPLASPTFTGDAKAVTATAGDNDTSLATTAFVTSAVTTATTPNATTLATGKIQLAGDLSGTATAPTITNAAVISKVLTGFTSGSGTVSATDSVLGAIQKLNGNDALKAPLASPTFTGDIKVNTNITVGRGAGNQTSNTVVGSNALVNNTTGVQNVAIGENALNANTAGGNQVAIGQNALKANTNSFSNVAIGMSALGANTTGGNNTAIGTSSLLNNTTGASNVALGSNSGVYIGTGTVANTISNSSIFIGANTRPAADNQTNQIVIGDQAVGLGSNSAVLGGDAILTTVLKGSVGIGTTTPGAKLEVSGQVKITGGSPALNKVLTSDATGLATWATPTLTGAGLASAKILVGNASNQSAAVSMTGDVSMNNAGVTTIADNAVTTADIADSQITTAKILDGAVGTLDLADNAVTTGKIIDGTVTNADLSSIATGVGGVYKGSGTLSGSTTITVNPNETLRILTTTQNGFSVGSNSFPSLGSGLTVSGSNNYVGINNSTPEYPLDIFTNVSSAIRLQSNGESGKAVHLLLNPGDYGGANTGIKAWDIGGSQVSLSIMTKNLDRLTFSPTTIVASHTISEPSDRRIKENIEDDTRYSLEDILKIQVRDYNLIKDPLKKTTIGFIAQELHEIFPDAVNPGNDDGDPFDGLKNVWSVDYAKLTPLLTKGIQELNQKVENQSKQIIELKAQIEQLKTMILNK